MHRKSQENIRDIGSSTVTWLSGEKYNYSIETPKDSSNVQYNEPSITVVSKRFPLFKRLQIIDWCDKQDSDPIHLCEAGREAILQKMREEGALLFTPILSALYPRARYR